MAIISPTTGTIPGEEGANSVAAKTLDLQDKAGSLEAGKSADILVLNKNPLEDISILRSKENIAYVVQGV